MSIQLQLALLISSLYLFEGMVINKKKQLWEDLHELKPVQRTLKMIHFKFHLVNGKKTKADNQQVAVEQDGPPKERHQHFVNVD